MSGGANSPSSRGIVLPIFGTFLSKPSQSISFKPILNHSGSAPLVTQPLPKVPSPPLKALNQPPPQDPPISQGKLQVNQPPPQDPPISQGKLQVNQPNLSLKVKAVQDLNGPIGGIAKPPAKSAVELAFTGNSTFRLEETDDLLPRVSFPVDVKTLLLAKVNHIIIAKFTHGRPPFKDFDSFLSSCKFTGRYRILCFDDKHVFIELENFDDFVKLWLVKNFSIKGARIRLFKWTEAFNPSSESSLCPVWVHLPCLPLFLLDEEALLSIGSAIGRVLFIDPRNLEHKKIGYASLCLELDANELQPEAVVIEFIGDGKVREKFIQKIVYDKIPSYCSACLHLGHEVGICKVGKKHSFKVEVTSTTTDYAKEMTNAQNSRERQLTAATVHDPSKDNVVITDDSSDEGENASDAVIQEQCFGICAQPSKDSTDTKSVAGDTELNKNKNTTAVGNSFNILTDLDANLDLSKVLEQLAGDIVEGSEAPNTSVHPKTPAISRAVTVSQTNEARVNSTPLTVAGTTPVVIEKVEDGLLQETIKESILQEEHLNSDPKESPTSAIGVSPSKSWGEEAEQNKEMDFSTPPFHISEHLIDEGSLDGVLVTPTTTAADEDIITSLSAGARVNKKEYLSKSEGTGFPNSNNVVSNSTAPTFLAPNNPIQVRTDREVYKVGESFYAQEGALNYIQKLKEEKAAKLTRDFVTLRKSLPASDLGHLASAETTQENMALSSTPGSQTNSQSDSCNPEDKASSTVKKVAGLASPIDSDTQLSTCPGDKKIKQKKQTKKVKKATKQGVQIKPKRKETSEEEEDYNSPEFWQKMQDYRDANPFTEEQLQESARMVDSFNGRYFVTDFTDEEEVNSYYPKEQKTTARSRPSLDYLDLDDGKSLSSLKENFYPP